MSYHSQSLLIISLKSFTFSCHIIHNPPYFMHMHAIGAAEEITLVELEADPQEENQEAQHQEALGEGKPEVDHLQECLDHQLATFVKGNPQSILTSYVF